MGTRALVAGIALILASALGALMPWIVEVVVRLWQR